MACMQVPGVLTMNARLEVMHACSDRGWQKAEKVSFGGCFSQIVVAVVVTLLVNWAHFMDWAHSNGRDLVLAAEGIAGREHRCHSLLLHPACQGHASWGRVYGSLHVGLGPTGALPACTLVGEAPLST